MASIALHNQTPYLWPQLHLLSPFNAHLKSHWPLGCLSHSSSLCKLSILLPRCSFPNCWMVSFFEIKVTFSIKPPLTTLFKITTPLPKAPYYPHLLYIFPKYYHSLYSIYFIYFRYYMFSTHWHNSFMRARSTFIQCYTKSLEWMLVEWINEWMGEWMR